MNNADVPVLNAPLYAQSEAPSSASTAVTKVHKVDGIAERTFWIGHTVFIALAIAGLAFIILARGPNRRDVVMNGVSEGKE
jgi:hypothetical protein